MITRDEYVGVMKWAGKSLAAESFTTATAMIFPFVLVPPFKQIVSTFYSTMLGLAMDKTEYGAWYVYTDIRVTKQGREVFEAARKSYQLRLGGTPKEKSDAKADLHVKFKQLAMLTT